MARGQTERAKRTQRHLLCEGPELDGFRSSGWIYGASYLTLNHTVIGASIGWADADATTPLLQPRRRTTVIIGDLAALHVRYTIVAERPTGPPASAPRHYGLYLRLTSRLATTFLPSGPSESGRPLASSGPAHAY